MIMINNNNDSNNNINNSDIYIYTYYRGDGLPQAYQPLFRLHRNQSDGDNFQCRNQLFLWPFFYRDVKDTLNYQRVYTILSIYQYINMNCQYILSSIVSKAICFLMVIHRRDEDQAVSPIFSHNYWIISPYLGKL